MTLAKKGRRTVELDGRRYHWTIRKRPTPRQELPWTAMIVAVELADAPVKGTLLVNCGVSRPDNRTAPHQTAVTPQVMREAIAASLAAGWQPEAAGTFEFQYPLIRDRA